ncbi:hypothetical protein B0H10DRAFT_1954326 [Mycena sp. CBHHK59/15]|nr:hypothetical protein B0H10DRAFT_1954326 [Mycena sp. CBHHK59/15]
MIFYTTQVDSGGLPSHVRRLCLQQAEFFAKSKVHFDSVKSAVLEVFPALLLDSGFIGDVSPGEDDFHLNAWFTWIASVIGAKTGGDALAAFESAYGSPVPPQIVACWNAWTVRLSWKMV